MADWRAERAAAMARKYGAEASSAPKASTSRAPGALGQLLSRGTSSGWDGRGEGSSSAWDELPTVETTVTASSLGNAAKQMGLSLGELKAMMANGSSGPTLTAGPSPGSYQLTSITSSHHSLRDPDLGSMAKEMGLTKAELEAMLAEAPGGHLYQAGEPSAKRRKIASTPAIKSQPRFLDGRIFLTPTPGRDTKNTIHISDLVDRDAVQSCFIYTYFWTPDALDDIIPEYTPQRRVIIGRDVNMDGARYQVDPKCQHLDEDAEPPKLGKADFPAVSAAMAQLYKQQRGYEAVYAHSSACAHTKMWLLEFSSFLRVIITSSNSMSQDFDYSDNHWYVHDFHRLPERAAGTKAPKRTPAAKEWERTLFGHALDLGMPRDYMDGVLSKRFDFSRVRVSLIASKPGITRPDLDDGDEMAYGLLRIKQLVGEEKTIAGMEICSASVGALHINDGAWLRQVWYAVSGGKVDWQPKTGNNGRGAPPMMSIVYPAKKDVDDLEEAGLLVLPKSSACQMGCHTKWAEASSRVRGYFRRYRSTDQGVLTHQKLMVVHHAPADPKTDVPSFVIFGSHNFSAAAWGTIEPANKRGPIGINPKNYELSVFVPGDVLVSLLAPGSVWGDLMTYERPAPPLRPGDKPFGSKVWVKNARDDYDDDE